MTQPITKIEFVGVHFKLGMEALDSRTKSGATIDRVINNLPEFECSKSNLFPTAEMPKGKPLKNKYADAFQFQDGTLYVCLGAVVRDHLCNRTLLAIDIPHPASIPWTSGGSEDFYVERATRVVRAFFAGWQTADERIAAKSN